MAKFVVLLVCLVAAIHTSSALKCKMCKDEACTTLEDQTCPAAPSNQESACLIHIYKDEANSKEIVEKKCVNQPKEGKFQCIRPKSSQIEVKCETCTKDFCNEKNSASAISMGMVTVFGVAVALIAPKLL